MSKFVKNTIILFIVFFLFSLISFFALDYSKVNLDFKNFNFGFSFSSDNSENLLNYKDINYNLIKQIPTEQLELIDMNVNNAYIIIEKSDENSCEIYSSKNDSKIMDIDNLKQIFDIKNKKGNISIDQINDYQDVGFKYVFKSTDPNELMAKINADNGVFSCKYSLKKLDINIDNSVIELKSSKSYPIDLNSENSVLNIHFDEYDATLKISFDVALGRFFDKNIISIDDMNILEKTLNSGKDSININADNLTLDIF